MKSYGKVDETWGDERFRTLIVDALGMAREGKERHAIGQDMNGNVFVTCDKPDPASIYVCWTTRRNRESPEDNLVLSDNCAYSEYSVEQMVPRARNALTRGIVDFGGLGFLSEGRAQLQGVFKYARILVKMHGEPFIMGWIDERVKTVTQSERDCTAGITSGMSKSIVIAPLSERSYFVDYVSCMVTKRGCWSLLDRIPDSDAYRYYGGRETESKTVCVSDRRSIRVHGPAFIYDAIREYGKNKKRTNPAKRTAYRMKQATQESQSKTPTRHDWFEKSKQVGAAKQEQKVSEHAITYFKQDGNASVHDEPIDFPQGKIRD